MRRFAFTLRLAATLGALVAIAHPALGVEIGSTLYVPSDVYNSSNEKSPEAQADAVAAGQAFDEARAAVEAGRVSDALGHACRALHLDPNHADARRLLGYQRIDDQWAGGYAKQMLESGHRWRLEYGWVKAEDVARYEAGQRSYGARWISPEEDARRHASIERGWTVRTDHFLVTTNIDRAAGVELATRLETVFQCWQQLFGEFVLAPADLKARLDGKQASGYLRKPFRVVYHRNRQEYNDALRRDQPQIEITLGIYFDAKRQSHFFAGPDQDPGTIAHEAVHQFFYESSPRPTRHLGATANVWAIEGVACYFETLQAIAPLTYSERSGEEPSNNERSIPPLAPPFEGGGFAFTIGQPDAGRVPAARYRRVVDGYYIPLAELSALGVESLHERPDIAQLYSQSAGLASYFMDYEDGRYRTAFRELLGLIYAGRDNAGKLAELTGQAYEELDREYAEFMNSLPVVGVIAD